MHPADIQAALKKCGRNQKSIADECGVSQSTVAHVLFGRSKSRRVATAISVAIGQPLDRIWPGKYPAHFS